MRIYSTCRTCHHLLDVADTQFDTHPNCDPAPDPQRDLDDLYRQHLLAGRFDEADTLEPVINRPPPPPRLLDSALHYASWGWPVFPCRPRGKAPLTRHGFKDATTDPDKIRAWWRSTPTANIGLPTGGAFDVIDIDTPKPVSGPAKLDRLDDAQRWAALHGGWRSYWQLQDAGALPDVHGVARTAGGGLHLFVLPNSSGEGNKAGILPGIDYRGRGGFVVAAPSVTETGPYRWEHLPSPTLTAAQVAG